MTTETATKLQQRIYRITLLMALAVGAVSPVFRDDKIAKIVGVASTVILVVLAGYRVLRDKS